LVRRRRAWGGALAAGVAVLAIGVPLALLPATVDTSPGSSVTEVPSTHAPTTPNTLFETAPPETVPPATIPPPAEDPVTADSTTTSIAQPPATTTPPPVTDEGCNTTPHDGQEIPAAVIETCHQLYELAGAADLAGLDALTGPEFTVEYWLLSLDPGWEAAYDLVGSEAGPDLLTMVRQTLGFTPRRIDDGRYLWPGWNFIKPWDALTAAEQAEVLAYFETTIEEIEAPGFDTVDTWWQAIASEVPLWVIIDDTGTVLYVGHEPD
jgi:hypothetical protein